LICPGAFCHLQTVCRQSDVCKSHCWCMLLMLRPKLVTRATAAVTTRPKAESHCSKFVRSSGQPVGAIMFICNYVHSVKHWIVRESFWCTFPVRACCIQCLPEMKAVQIVTSLQMLLLMFVMQLVLYFLYKPAARSWQCMHASQCCPA